jgi:hypothetical protein
MASIQETLRAALAADSAVTALVGDRIFPGQVPDDEATTPWLYYAVPDTTPIDSLDDDQLDAQSEVEFHALADTYATAKALIDAVFAALDGYVGGQIWRVLWTGTSEDSTEEGYHHAAKFTVWWRTATIVAASGSRARITTGLDSITLAITEHTLTLTSDGLLLDGQPVGTGVASGNLDGGGPSTNYGGTSPLDGGSP